MGIDAEMFVRHTGLMTEQEVRRLAREMCARFDAERFMIRKEDCSYDKAHHALSILVPTVWEQDGPDIVGEPGEQFIRVHLYTRYYGIGYERGDWILIRSVAEFLELSIPHSQIWYGGDSSGVLANHLDQQAREVLNRHWLSVGHEPYRSAWGEKGPPCEFCGGAPFHHAGGGGNKTFFVCDGCDTKLIRVHSQLRSIRGFQTGRQAGFLRLVAAPPQKDEVCQ